MGRVCVTVQYCDDFMQGVWFVLVLDPLFWGALNELMDEGTIEPWVAGRVGDRETPYAIQTRNMLREPQILVLV